MQDDTTAPRFIDYFLIGGVKVDNGLVLENNSDDNATQNSLHKRASVVSNRGHSTTTFNNSNIPGSGDDGAEANTHAYQNCEEDGNAFACAKTMPTSPLAMEYSADMFARYPLEDYAELPLVPSRVLSFCFPKGLKVSQVYTPPRFHTFVNTNETGIRMYGGTLVFMEPLESPLRDQLALMYSEYQAMVTNHSGDGLAKSSDRCDSSTTNEISSLPKDLYLPKCLTLLSHLPLILTLKDLLAQLYMLSQQPNCTSLESVIVNICKEIPVPPSGQTEVEIKLTPQSVFFSRPAVNYYYPVNSDFCFDTIFRCMPIDCVVELFTHTMLEHRIVLLSSSTEKLHTVAETLCSFLFPFYWQHVYIPVLPSNLVAFLAAPMPYLIGIDIAQQDIALREGGSNSDIVYANLDEGSLVCTYSSENMLPDHILRKVTNRLVSAVRVYDQNQNDNSTKFGGNVFDIDPIVCKSKIPPARPPAPSHDRMKITPMLAKTTTCPSVPTSYSRRTESPSASDVKTPPDVPARTYQGLSNVLLCKKGKAEETALRMRMTYAAANGISCNSSVVNGGPSAGSILSLAETAAFQQKSNQLKVLSASSDVDPNVCLARPRLVEDKEHFFIPKRFMTITYCSSCGATIGAFSNALICTECGYICHKANDCSCVRGSCGPRFNSASVRDAFLMVFITLLVRYREFLTDDDQFNKVRFLDASDDDYKAFLQTILGTQAFTQFIVERTERDDNDYEVLFFDEHIKRKLGRSSKAKIWNSNHETPFLDDPSYLVAHTHITDEPLQLPLCGDNQKLAANGEYSKTASPSSHHTEREKFIVNLSKYSAIDGNEFTNRPTKHADGSSVTTIPLTIPSSTHVLANANTNSNTNANTNFNPTKRTKPLSTPSAPSVLSLHKRSDRTRLSISRSPSTMMQNKSPSAINLSFSKKYSSTHTPANEDPRTHAHPHARENVNAYTYTQKLLGMYRFPTSLCPTLLQPRVTVELVNEASLIKLKANTAAHKRKARLDKARRNKAMKTLTALPEAQDFEALDEKQREVMFSMAVDFVHHQITKTAFSQAQMSKASKIELMSVLEVLHSQQQLLMDALDLSQGSDETNEVHTEMRTLQTQIAAHLDQLQRVCSLDPSGGGTISGNVAILTKEESDDARDVFSRSDVNDHNVWSLARMNHS
eukprot:CFRG0652T1